MNIEILYQVILMFAGIGAIIYGIKVMNGGVESILGFKFKKVLAKQSKKHFQNYMIGSGMGFVVQTSTVPNMMAVGLVNIGTINLTQAIAICLGAGFGGALALVLLMFESISVIKILCLFVFIGAIMLVFTKSNKGQLISKIFLGFGLLCFGITVLSNSVDQIVSEVNLTNFFASIKSPILFLLICFALTVLMQSGYPVFVILISLVSLGLIDFETACFGILGVNVGSACVTSLLLAALDEGNNGKRLIVFNILQKLLFSIIVGLLMLIPNWVNYFHNTICGGEASVSVVAFNILLCFIPIVLLPFCSQLSNMMKYVIKDKTTVKQGEYSSFELDEKTANSPVVAYEKIKQNIERIYVLIWDLSKNSHDSLFNEEKYVSQKNKVKSIEKAIKLTNNSLIALAGKLSGKELTKINILIDVVANLQRLLKENANIIEFCEKKSTIQKEINKSQLKYVSTYYVQVLDFGAHIKTLFDENLPDKQRSEEFKIIFKTNDIMILNRNKAKKKIIKNDNFAEQDNTYYFGLLYSLENIQQDYFDITIKLALLED